tara:strand:+ start:641 stop:799 length:159 start_codon:yes stop_codon:yes gene_type:complete
VQADPYLYDGVVCVGADALVFWVVFWVVFWAVSVVVEVDALVVLEVGVVSVV